MAEQYPLPPSVLLRIQRADENLHVLADEVEGFLKRSPYAVRHERDDEAGEYVWRVEVKERPYEGWSLLASEIVHHLHCALDHVVWLASGEKPPRSAGFPIFQSSEAYRRFFSRGSGYHLTERLPHHAQAIVEDLQPYQRGNAYAGHPLWVLRGLANDDKHETLHFLGGAMPTFEFTSEVEGGTADVAQPKVFRGPFEDGAILARWPLPPPSTAGTKVTVHFKPSLHVAFPKGGPAAGREVVKTLVDVRNAVYEAVERLAPFAAH
jgi:hypothetical protein